MDMIATIAVRKRILLVEDDAAIRRALQLLLTGEGYDVRSYARATGLSCDPEALSADFLIADLILPDGDAFELLEKLRAAGWPGAAVLISGYLTPERVRSALRAGFVRVLAKPFRDTELARAIVELLRP